MRICLVSEYFPKSEKCEVRGGVEARCFFIAKHLAKKHKVTVLTSWEKGTKKKDKFAGIDVIRCGKQRSYSQKGSFFGRASFMKEAYKEGIKLKFDLVDGYNYISYLPAYNIAEKLKIPSIATYHDVWVGRWVKNVGIIGILGEIMERKTLAKNWTRFIAVSSFTKLNLIEVGIDKDRIDVVYNGVDLKEHRKIKIKKYAKPTICCIARLVTYKRVDDLINALKIINKKIHVQCKIIGVGPERKKLESLSKGLDVEFLGFVKKHEDVLTVLKKSHIFCLPSIVEGFGMGTVEAMACGVPYVCSSIAPVKEVTNNGVGGLLFRSRIVDNLAKKIILLLENKNLYKKKQKEASEFVKRYDWSNIVKKVEEVYKKTCKK